MSVLGKATISRSLPAIGRRVAFIGLSAGMLGGLYLTASRNYLLFHCLVELFSVVVGVSIFVIAWNGRRFISSGCFLVLGVAYLFVSSTDLLHTLAYRGMGVFAASGSNLAAQLWIAARYLECLSLLVAMLVSGRKVGPKPMFGAYAGVFCLAMLSIFRWGIFPTCFDEATGLTPFKKISEYVIIGILAAAIGLLWRRRDRFDRRVAWWVALSIVATMVSEFAFTLYRADPYGTANMLGHFLKILSFYLIYKALIETGLRQPHEVLFRDLKLRQEQLRASEGRLRSIFEAAESVAFVTVDPGGAEARILDISPGAQRIFGYCRRELIGKPIAMLLRPVDVGGLGSQTLTLRRTKRGLSNETILLAKGGREFPALLRKYPIFDGAGEMAAVLFVAVDITESKEVAKYQALTARLLEELNRPTSRLDSLSSVTGMIKDSLDFEAVGVRLRDGEDYPYFVTQGFPGEFVEAENYLCARDADGGRLLDRDGKAVLECMCGAVLAGRFDPGKPWFSEAGSFWTNSTSELLAGAADVGGERMRNRCNTAGYESLALIPVRCDAEIVGLLQLNDRRSGRFTEVMIRFLEHIAASIGMAIRRKGAEEALRRARDELEQRVADRTAELRRTVDELEAQVRQRIDAERKVDEEHRRMFSLLNVLPGHVALKDRNYRIRYANRRFVQLFGEPANRPCYAVQMNRSSPCEHCPLAAVIETNRPEETEWTCPTGRTYRSWFYPFADIDGEALALELGIDVTDRKELQRQVIEASEAERRNIGRDLHDTLGQNLTGLAFQVKGLSRRLRRQLGEEPPATSQIVQLVNESISQVRSLAKGLDPVGLHGGGLTAGLRELAASVEEVYGVRCEFRGPAPVELADSVATHLYHIAQEAVTNAAKHSKAGRISITLGTDGDDITLTVADDGAGIVDSARKTGGMGMRIMRYRAGVIGGSFRVGAGSDGGTVVSCIVAKPDVGARREQ